MEAQAGTMRCCACCRLPTPIHAIHHGTVAGVGVVFAVCVRCDAANRRLPTGAEQKRLNRAGGVAASDATGRYYAARFSDPVAAKLAAHMLGNPATGRDAAKALGWIE